MALGVFQDHEQATGWTLSVVFGPICIFATVLRFVATRCDRRSVGWEDWHAVLALLCFLSYLGYALWSEFKPVDTYVG